MKKARKPYPLDPKTIFGLSTMRFTNVAGASLMTSAFMLYLTDYSGIQNAAFIATVLLLAGRILDALDDPLQGWIMDNSKRTKIGKFKPFMLGGIITTTLALLLLFNTPDGIAEWGKILLLSLGYLLYEIGYSFQPDYALKSTMTQDAKVREKLLIVPRVVETIIAVPFSFFITISLALGAVLGGNNHAGFGVATAIFIIPMGLIAFIGAALVKEGPFSIDSKESIGIKEIARMFKENKPLWVSQLAGLIGGCSFTFTMAAVTYYIKWAYGPENFGMNSAIWGACILLGMLTGTMLAGKLLKNRTPIQGAYFCYIGQAVPLVIVFILNLFGPVHLYLFLGLMFINMIFSGMNYIPGSMLNMECMDFNHWKRGVGMEGMVQAINNFTIKAQTALAGLATGAVLVAIQYDAALYESDAFIASGGVIPTTLYSGLAIVFALIPVLLSAIAAVILIAYPLKGELREQMYRELNERRNSESND
jgi:Na+/melibiose symporter-like transporter